MTYELLLVGLALLNGLHESEVSAAKFFVQLAETLPSSDHHFHDEERICFISAQVELLPSALPDDVLPELPLLVVPVKLPSVLVHVPVETQHFDVRESLLAHDQMLDGSTQHFLNQGPRRCHVKNNNDQITRLVSCQ